ncbi:hypothetical protein [Brevundimonas sp.]|uniref:hypothetical protein n=1 Tax=Brevundimonas sp. TaxID=1871086 RepID=UPI0025D7D108|nr:hypothetical protein [Brevundimonas sp.]
MIETAERLKEQASRCRRLARGLAPGDVADALNELAGEYESMARVAEEPRSFDPSDEARSAARIRERRGDWI